MVQVESVIFDMDGLMFDTERFYFEANQHVLNNMGYDFQLEDYQNVVGMSGQAFMDGMLEILPDEESYHQFIQAADDYFLELVKERHVPIKPGLYELIDYLEEEGILRSIASSSDRVLIDHFLEQTSLQSSFDHVVAGDQVQHVKPHPEPYLKVWKKTGVRKDRTWVLEDSISGVRSAKAAGLHVILVPDLQKTSPEEKEEADHVFQDLFEVKDFFML